MALQETFEEQGNLLFKRRGHIPLFALAVAVLWYVFLLRDCDAGVNCWWLDFLFLCVGFAGLGVRVFTVGFTPRGTSGRNTSEGQVAERLNTSGIYSVVRHPLYIGNFLMWLAPVLVLRDLWFTLFICAFFWIYYERIMFAEEQFLRKKFGGAYLDWSNETPALFPKFSRYKRADLRFSLRNALKREYIGFFNLVFVMTLLRAVGFAVTEKKVYLDKPWIIIFSASLFISILIRALNKLTKVLDVEGR
jgi:protein-S-isoprenylcysteine O-methyltransferase Ste14